MNMLLNSLVLAILFSFFANGTPIKKRHDKYIAHDFEEVQVSALDKRFETAGLVDNLWRYKVNLKIGSAQEEVAVFLDTGSLRLLVPEVNSTCDKGKPCSSDISWNPFHSKTFKNSTIPAKSAFGPGITGFEVSDDVYFKNGDKVPQFEFDLLNTMSYELGILGAGYSTHTNASYVLAAKAAGLINHGAFSVFKGQGKDGTYLLGGIDKAKYEGDLFIFDSTSLMPAKKLTTSNGNVIPFDYPIIQDCGIPAMTLLTSVIQEIYEDIGADENGHVPCDHVLGGNKGMTITIGPIDIPLYYSDFFYKISSTTCASLIYKTDNAKYQFLGLPFFKNTYFAQNFDTKKIAIAPVKHTEESDIVDFWF
ncbi:SAP98 [Candida metapsilosis]|uniref:SAP98 n=1 Tax=Candida metapsilosis TaxID=273372 RepID=A0A8H7ZC41_9ASCO|nr:SAP98 [Candida metapsilosis]